MTNITALDDTATIHMLIDPQHGFMDAAMTEKTGGVLYVPDGEAVIAPMAALLRHTRNGIFILSQDFHPADHISFMTNHPAVMQDRIERFRRVLQAAGQDIPDTATLYQQAQQPVHVFGKDIVATPFDDIVLDENRNIMGVLMPDGRVRKVVVETVNGHPPDARDRGRITKMQDVFYPDTFAVMKKSGRDLATQTLWIPHCIAGTQSSLFPPALGLPAALMNRLSQDTTGKTIHYHDARTGNTFYVVRKGMQRDVDSYGIGVENDGVTRTTAPAVFKDIAQRLAARGVKKAEITIGGLATNFCVEFSANNTVDFLAPYLHQAGIRTRVSLVTDMSRGIPVAGGSETPFSLAGVAARLKQTRRIGETTTQAILGTGGAARRTFKTPQPKR